MEVQCLLDIQAMELAAGLSYRWIVKARPDAFWSGPPPPLASLSTSSITLPGGLDFKGYNDRLALGPRWMMPLAFCRLHAMREYAQRHPK